MGSKVRRAKISDAAIISAIDASISEDRRLEVGRQPLEYYQEWLRCHDKRHPVLIGSDEEQGIAWWMALSRCNGSYCFDGAALVEMGVPDPFQNTELIDRILHYLEQCAVRQGYYKLIACLDARQRYLLHIYRRVGFRDVGTLRSQAYHKGQLLDMVLLERVLPADMEALQRYYTDHYDCYRAYFEEERRRTEAEAQGEYVLEYEEVETPEDQLPEGIVRFLRAKRTPDGQPVRRMVPRDTAGPELTEEPTEEGRGSAQAGPPAEGEAAPAGAPPAAAPVRDDPAPATPGGQAQLPEGIIRFLKSKRLPDGTPVNQSLPPVVPVKLAPAQERPQQPRHGEGEGEGEPLHSE